MRAQIGYVENEDVFISLRRTIISQFLACIVSLFGTHISFWFVSHFRFYIRYFSICDFFSPEFSDEIALFSYQSLVVNTIPNEITFVHAKHIFMAK